MKSSDQLPTQPPDPKLEKPSGSLQESYRIIHKTHYAYSDPVSICQNEIRMRPRSMGHVVCHQSSIATIPVPTWNSSHVDYYGNAVLSFSVEAMHKELLVTAESEVTVCRPSYLDVSGSPEWETVGRPTGQQLIGSGSVGSDGVQNEHSFVDEFLHPSPRIVSNDAMRNYAAASFPPGRPIMDAALELTKRINTDFKYDPGATTVTTPVGEVFQKRRGVCQDFAHLQIAMLRSIGVPACYVSGYLRTRPPIGKPRLVGADESHAWISVYAGQAIGWVDYDPTNASLAGTDHIPIAMGRDYGDVTPMRGIVIGGGIPRLSVSVDVAPIDSPQPSRQLPPTQ